MGSEPVPILSALKEYQAVTRFHMPGHKGGGGAGEGIIGLLGEQPFRADVTNVPGLDDLNQPAGIIQEAQELAAQAFGAEQTFFLINGSSCGLHALVLSVCRQGDKIIVPRNIHRSVLSGIILAGAEPVYFLPEYEAEMGIPLGIAPPRLEEVIRCHPEARAVLVVNPTYHGLTSDLPAIAELAHVHHIPLLVDEAHGPHLAFHEALPPAALSCGADAVVQGTHKMLGAFTQAAMLHLQGNRVDRDRLAAILRLLQSTSTSYLLLSSLDAARAQVVEEGHRLLEEAIKTAAYLRDAINAVPGLSCFGQEIIGRGAVKGLDPLKLTVRCGGLGLNGMDVERLLRQQWGVQVEMSDPMHVLLLVTFGNTRREADTCLEALQVLARQHAGSAAAWRPEPVFPLPDMVLTPAAAFYAASRAVALEEAAGQVSAETVACYPPGIPLLCPGERISEEMVAHLARLRRAGITFHGPSERTLRWIKVIS